jgi:hypothetical protein
MAQLAAYLSQAAIAVQRQDGVSLGALLALDVTLEALLHYWRHGMIKGYTAALIDICRMITVIIR